MKAHSCTSAQATLGIPKGPHKTRLWLAFRLTLLLFSLDATWVFGRPVPPQEDRSDEQLWYGTMDAQNLRQFRFVVRLTQQDGESSGVLTSLDEGGRDFQLSNIITTPDQLEFELPSTAATYEAQWDARQQVMVGQWQQRGQKLDLSFRRVDEVPQRKIRRAWQGKIQGLLQKIDVAFVELESGQILFDSLSQKAGGFYVQDESREGEIIYSVPGVQGTFTGRATDNPMQLEGKWRQGLLTLALNLTAVDRDPVAADPVRPQTPHPPFSYTTRDVDFPSQDPQVTLAGTLTLPQGGLKAGVVLISGSGPQDRDESLLDHKPFWVIADHFARHGIATLRYDDRGVGKSTGDHAKATTVDFADDAEGAFMFLSSQKELSGVPVGLAGHSEGGIIAPIVAARNENVAFVVLMAGTGVNGEEVLYSQLRLIMEAEGAEPAAIEKQIKLQRVLLSTVVDHSKASQEELGTQLAEVVERWFADEDLKEDELEQTTRSGLDSLTSPWLRTFLTLEPRDALSKTRCPVLALGGERDLQVDPKLNLPAIRRALEEADNSHFEIVEMPGLNHLFQACTTGSVSEYANLEETFNVAALEKITEWILSVKDPP